MFFVFFIPVVVLALAFYFYKHRINWLEALGQLAIPVLFVFAFKGCAVMNLTEDTEYWSTTVSKAEYYEAWDEYIEQTCECCCDDDGENCSEYDCSYTRYHDEYWQMVDRDGNSYRISQDEYNRLVRKFGDGKAEFVDLDRDFHRNDGDKYVAAWDGSDEDLEICVTSHTYENRPQAASSVFNYPKVSEEEKSQYELYDYPKIVKNQKQDHFLGGNDKEVERKLDILNAKLGPKKQVKLFVLVFKNKTRRAGQMQEWYWKGGNKNEFIVTIGLNDDDEVQWCYPFSWSESQLAKVNVRTFIEEQDTINWNSTVDYLYSEMEDHFKRKEFADFDYLTVELTSTQLIWLYIVTLIICVIIAIVFIGNDFDSNDTYGSDKDWRYKSRKRFHTFNSYLKLNRKRRFRRW